VAYGYFWFSEGAYRVMGDSVPKHTRPTSLTDTHPRTEPSEPRIVGEISSISLIDRWD